MVPPTGHVTLYPVAGIPSTLSAIILVRGRHGWTLLICRIVNPDADIRVIKYRRNPGSEGKNHPTLGRDLAKDREPGTPIRGGLVPRGLLTRDAAGARLHKYREVGSQPMGRRDYRTGPIQEDGIRRDGSRAAAGPVWGSRCARGFEGRVGPDKPGVA